GIRLSKLFRMNDYPKDMMVLYAQGHSVVRFLLGRRPEMIVAITAEGKPALRYCPAGFEPPREPGLIAFLRIGTGGNTAETWDRARKEVEGCEAGEKREEAGLDGLNHPEPGGNPAGPSPARPKDEKPDLTPPTNLPGVARPTPRQ